MGGDRNRIIGALNPSGTAHEARAVRAYRLRLTVEIDRAYFGSYLRPAFSPAT